MGRKAFEYSVEAFVVGDDWQEERDALQDALLEPGPGELVHPRYGRLQLQAGTFTVKHPARNMAVFTIRFHEVARDTTGGVVENLAQKLAEATDRIDGLMDDTFGEVWNAAGVTSDFARTLTKGVAGIVDSLLAPGATLANTADRFRSDVAFVKLKTASIIAKPGDLAARLRRTFRLSSRKADFSLFRAYRAALVLLDAQLHRPGAPATYREREEARVAGDMNFFFRGQVAISATRVAAALNYETTEEALAIRREVSDLIREQENLSRQYNPVLVQEFRDLRLLFGRLLPAAGLRSVTTYLPDEDLPSLVIAQRLYQNPDTAAQIIARNQIRHPGLIRGDEPLQVVR